jgi:hypothetical protein
MRENMQLLYVWSWLHLTLCPPIISIYLQTPCHYFLWLEILHCVYIPQFLDPFINCRVHGLFLKLGFCEKCCNEHHCTGVSIVSSLTFLWGRCPGAVSLDHMAILSWVFWGISILLSIVVVLDCIPTSSV